MCHTSQYLCYKKIAQLTDDLFWWQIKLKVGHNLHLVVTTHTVLCTKRCRKTAMMWSYLYVKKMLDKFSKEIKRPSTRLMGLLKIGRQVRPSIIRLQYAMVHKLKLPTDKNNQKCSNCFIARNKASTDRTCELKSHCIMNSKNLGQKTILKAQNFKSGHGLTS